MDDDIKENLLEVGNHVKNIGSQICSTKVDLSKLILMVDLLRMASDTLDTYIIIQKDRYNSI